jgi:2-oxoglutarate ferredoxin oxidoreductase subunit delta
VNVLTRGTVVIEVDRCKGCELCIPACPPQVLSMSHDFNQLGFHVPVLHPGCTGCQACQAICPDWVFTVFRYEEPIELDDAGITESGTESGQA